MTRFKLNMKESDCNRFLPITLEEGKQYYKKFNKKFSQFDIVFITGDPYYDHPLSGVALLSRLLDRRGYKVGIIAQPQTDEEYLACGRPRYFFCITSGLLDSMLANYTPMLHERENVLVPERALIRYTQKVKELFKGSMTVLGGVEATIRRFTHFDYKDNMLRRGILNDSKADLLLYGQAERPLLILLQRMAAVRKAIEKKCQKERKEEHKEKRKKEYAEERKLGTFDEMRSGLDLFSLDGAVFRVKEDEIGLDIRRLPSYEECVSDKNNFRLLTLTHYQFPDSFFIEPCGKGFVQHNRSGARLTEKEMDYIYAPSFTRKLHPSSKNIELNQEAVEKLENSVVIGRGCWGGCSFCIIPLVQQKELTCRSRKSILKEVEKLYQQGVTKIDDLTIPTLNMFGSYCKLYDEKEIIYSPIIKKDITIFRRKKPCNQHCVGCKERVLNDELSPLLEDIAKLQKRLQKKNLPGKKGLKMEQASKPRQGLELRSAIRHDIILQQGKLFPKIMGFTSRLKIAPEHVCDSVLKQMNKGTREDFERFLKEYKRINDEQKTDKNLVPYFIAAHPGCTMGDMKALRKFCTENKLYVNLTQVFTPTPGTASTAAYYTALDTFTGKPIYVPRTFREKKDQKNILLFAKEVEEDDVRE